MDEEHRRRTRRANWACAVAGIVVSALILTGAKLAAAEKVKRADRATQALAAIEWIAAGARREPAIGAYRARKKVKEYLGTESGQVMENLARIYEARADPGSKGRREGRDTERTRSERDAREQLRRGMPSAARTLAIAHEQRYERQSVVAAPLGVLEMRDLGNVATAMVMVIIMIAVPAYVCLAIIGVATCVRER